VLSENKGQRTALPYPSDQNHLAAMTQVKCSPSHALHAETSLTGTGTGGGQIPLANTGGGALDFLFYRCELALSFLLLTNTMYDYGVSLSSILWVCHITNYISNVHRNRLLPFFIVIIIRAIVTIQRNTERVVATPLPVFQPTRWEEAPMQVPSAVESLNRRMTIQSLFAFRG
jgi:hypothetical protein